MQLEAEVAMQQPVMVDNERMRQDSRLGSQLPWQCQTTSQSPQWS